MQQPTQTRVCHPATLAGAVWRKSSHSQGASGECVEVARAAGVVGVRDSKDPGGPVLALAPAELRALAAEIKRGEHHL
ncbi:DUF397 domain-containing protein [Actinomadura nitritigenes]|jgi:hypothetical protein|uniref:DUF397 domain-containing protein n=1 Tax=Actinomadura nitritigenes TaxID=134602 RepID=UPI00367986F2